ncbi:MAG: hypothetical protein CML20_12460 [Rheinheimera sp.]|uniref:hypothetical protein n=1 Tax=Arsukibacterium sp. UBA3155 TaxID=1946058 RepID=UPI000C8909ED|nr:hypothetical protein [Arsukibacterium sp. UBA3155]MAD75577.1 hypothetical protein [Rheinheimera sp.]|tara:strand:- start:3743 stop:6505 length:2763 start_codon:yes stop_codon:yes gene_type:complete
MIPRRSLELIDSFKAHSTTLSADVETILIKACKPDAQRDCAGHDVTAERLKDLHAYIELTNNAEPLPYFNKFITEGFNILSNQLDWANIEQELFLVELKQVHTRRGGSVLSSLMHLAKTFFDEQNLWPPSRAVAALTDRTIDISQLLCYPANWVVDGKKIIENILQLPNGYNKYNGGISLLLKVLAEARNEPIIVQQLHHKTITDALDDDDIFQLLLAKIPVQNQSRFKKIRSVHNPALHGPERKFAGKTNYSLKAGAESKGAHWIHQLSAKWFEQCQSYVNNVYQSKGQKAAISTITRLTKLASAMFDHRDSLTNLQQLHRQGVTAFFCHDQALLRQVHSIDDERINSSIGEICYMHNQLHGSNYQLTDLVNLAINIDCDSGDDQSRLIILDPLAAKYPALAQAIYDYAQYELQRIDGDQRSKETVFGQVSMVKAIFTSHLDLLDNNDHLMLADLGLAALELNNCRIIKRIRSVLNDKFKDDRLTLGSARGIQSAFGLFCAHYKLANVHSYTVSGKKRAANDTKNKATDYYSKEQVAAIAYAIELGLMHPDLSAKDELLLRLGRILIKTGWNLAPLLMLEIDDILQLDAPLTGKSTHFVRLFKKRGGYTTQFYEFELTDESITQEGLVFGAAVTNALTDLEYIRDKMSSALRARLPADSKLRYRLALYPDKRDKVLSLTHTTFSKLLNEVLRRFECKIAFSVQRIRKGGLNYVYKTYAKKFHQYHQAGQHSLKVFMDVYLRDDGIKSEETIASATQIMSDYFSGRPISDKIVIVTDIPANTRQTPSGRCASTGNDAEAAAYAKQQQRLNRASDTTSSQCGDFNACLFCQHFRLVADKEHVWRLLSYQRYIVAEMARGISDYESNTDQAAYVDVLNKRIETMLAELREISTTAVQNGIALLDSRGCHDDWAFYADIGVAR